MIRSLALYAHCNPDEIAAALRYFADNPALDQVYLGADLLAWRYIEDGVEYINIPGRMKGYVAMPWRIQQRIVKMPSLLILENE
jgi:hypothetical protein